VAITSKNDTASQRLVTITDKAGHHGDDQLSDAVQGTRVKYLKEYYI
jgi:hypothetical protein